VGPILAQTGNLPQAFGAGDHLYSDDPTATILRETIQEEFPEYLPENFPSDPDGAGGAPTATANATPSIDEQRERAFQLREQQLREREQAILNQQQQIIQWQTQQQQMQSNIQEPEEEVSPFDAAVDERVNQRLAPIFAEQRKVQMQNALQVMVDNGRRDPNMPEFDQVAGVGAQLVGPRRAVEMLQELGPVECSRRLYQMGMGVARQNTQQNPQAFQGQAFNPVDIQGHPTTMLTVWHSLSTLRGPLFRVNCPEEWGCREEGLPRLVPALRR